MEGGGRFGTAMNISPGALIYAILCAGRFTTPLFLSPSLPFPYTGVCHRRSTDKYACAPYIRPIIYHV